MKHIALLIYSFFLFAGVWAVFYSRQIHKTYLVELPRYLAQYLVCFNLSLLVYQVYEYVYMNLLGRDLERMPTSLVVLWCALVFLAETGMLLTMIRIALELAKRTLSTLLRRVLTVVVVCWGSSLAGGILAKLLFDSRGLMQASLLGFFYFAHLVTLSVLVWLATTELPDLGREQVRAVKLFALLFEGKSYDEIKDQLYISFNTVKNHVYNLYQKLGVSSRGQLVRLILEIQRNAEG